MRRLILVLALAVSTSASAAGITAFVDVSVVPMDQQRVLPHQTVLIEDGAITALGPAASVTVPAGAARIEGHGAYLMPGLADMHTHIEAKEANCAISAWRVSATTRCWWPRPGRRASSS